MSEEQGDEDYCGNVERQSLILILPSMKLPYDEEKREVRGIKQVSEHRLGELVFWEQGKGKS